MERRSQQAPPPEHPTALVNWGENKVHPIPSRTTTTTQAPTTTTRKDPSQQAGLNVGGFSFGSAPAPAACGGFSFGSCSTVCLMLVSLFDVCAYEQVPSYFAFEQILLLPYDIGKHEEGFD